MYKNTDSVTSPRKYVLFMLCVFSLAVAGCTGKYTKTVPDDTSVTSSSKEFTNAARAINETCPLGAEFGRCGCTLDGIRTSCAFVLSCLDAGFCVRVAE